MYGARAALTCDPMCIMYDVAHGLHYVYEVLEE